jgi:cytochrome P450
MRLVLKDRRNRKEGEEKITNEEIIDEIKTFMVAGSDTTTSFITAMLFFVCEKPELVERLRKEIDCVITTDKDINVNNFKKLPFL